MCVCVSSPEAPPSCSSSGKASGVVASRDAQTRTGWAQRNRFSVGNLLEHLVISCHPSAHLILHCSDRVACFGVMEQELKDKLKCIKTKKKKKSKKRKKCTKQSDLCLNSHPFKNILDIFLQKGSGEGGNTISVQFSRQCHSWTLRSFQLNRILLEPRTSFCPLNKTPLRSSLWTSRNCRQTTHTVMN